MFVVADSPRGHVGLELAAYVGTIPRTRSIQAQELADDGAHMVQVLSELRLHVPKQAPPQWWPGIGVAAGAPGLPRASVRAVGSRRSTAELPGPDQAERVRGDGRRL